MGEKYLLFVCMVQPATPKPSLHITHKVELSKPLKVDLSYVLKLIVMDSLTTTSKFEIQIPRPVNIDHYVHASKGSARTSFK